jgi:hypothetical protein
VEAIRGGSRGKGKGGLDPCVVLAFGGEKLGSVGAAEVEWRRKEGSLEAWLGEASLARERKKGLFLFLPLQFLNF